MNIYVGNVESKITEENLQKKFEEFGEVTSVNIIKDKFTGEPRGFGFVEMSNEENGEEAISALDGTELNGKSLVVNKARPRSDFKKRSGNDIPRGGRYNRQSSGRRRY